MEPYQALLRLLLVFPLVIILTYFALRFFLKRFAPALGMGRRVQVLERVALNSRTFLYVVKVENEYLLIGTSANNVVVLKDLGTDWGENIYGDNELMAGFTSGEPVSFDALLQRLKEKIPGDWKTGKWKQRLKILSTYGKKTKKVEREKEEFVNLRRNYKLRKVKEEEDGNKNI